MFENKNIYKKQNKILSLKLIINKVSTTFFVTVIKWNKQLYLKFKYTVDRCLN